MGEIIQDMNPLNLTSWFPTEALNTLSMATEGGEQNLVKPKHLLLAVLLLVLGMGAFLMYYSVSLRIPNPWSRN